MQLNGGRRDIPSPATLCGFFKGTGVADHICQQKWTASHVVTHYFDFLWRFPNAEMLWTADAEQRCMLVVHRALMLFWGSIPDRSELLRVLRAHPFGLAR